MTTVSTKISLATTQQQTTKNEETVKKDGRTYKVEQLQTLERVGRAIYALLLSILIVPFITGHAQEQWKLVREGKRYTEIQPEAQPKVTSASQAALTTPTTPQQAAAPAPQPTAEQPAPQPAPQQQSKPAAEQPKSAATSEQRSDKHMGNTLTQSHG